MTPQRNRPHPTFLSTTSQPSRYLHGRQRKFKFGTTAIAVLLCSLGCFLTVAIADDNVVWRETFAEGWINEENPGNFAGGIQGKILGGLPNGPVWEEEGVEVSRSAGIRRRKAHEGPEGDDVLVFEAFQPVPEELSKRGVVSLWLRPSSNQNIVLGSLLDLQHERQGGQWSNVAGLMLHSGPGSSLDITMGRAIVERNRGADFEEKEILNIPADEWCLLWLAYDEEEGVALYAQTTPDGEPKLVSRSAAPENGLPEIERLHLFSGGRATRGHFAGRLGPLTLHRLSNWADAGKVPVNDRWPDNLPTTWTVSPEESEHDLDNRIIGGWENLEHAVLWHAILPRANNAWTDSDGNPAGYETLEDTESKRQWWLDWKEGKFQPMGDRVEFQPGVYRAPGRLPIPRHGGIHYTLVDGAEEYSADIRGSELLMGDWVQPEPERHPRVWRYEGEKIPSRHVWGGDWQSFTIFRTADGPAAAIPAMDARPWASFTDPDGVTYISLPDGVTPEDIGPLEGSRAVGFDWSGAWLGPLLIQATATYEHNHDRGHGHTIAAYALGVSAGPYITIIEGRGLRCAKHPAAFTGGGEGGLCIWYRTDLGFDPPGPADDDPPGFGVSAGSFTPLVDYSSRLTSVEEPGSVVTIYDKVTYKEPTEPGDGTTKAKPARRAMYFTHGRGDRNAHMFALTIVRNPDPTMFDPDPDQDNFPVLDPEKPGPHRAFEVIVEDEPR